MVSVLVYLLLILGCITYIRCPAPPGPVDMKATEETQALYKLLYSLARNPNYFLFGHKATTQSGISGGIPPYETFKDYKGFQAWKFTNTMVSRNATDELSDVKLVSGYFPAFVGFEFFQLDSQWLAMQRYLSQRAYARGMIIAMTWHFGNLATGGNFYDLHGYKVVRNLLPGGTLNLKYNEYLDKIADYAHNLVDDKGRPIPFILRLFHESNGPWFWWGLKNAVNNTGEDLKDAYRYIVDYLSDFRGCHNILYAYSPNAGFTNLTAAGSLPSYMEAYPGDQFVDILGYDDYSYVRSPKTLQKFVDALSEVVLYSEEHQKIPALTEVGLNILNQIDQIPDWWNDYILNSIKGVKYVKPNPATKRIAYVLTWANNCQNATVCSYYTPYKGHPGEKDFLKFTQDSMVVMLGKP